MHVAATMRILFVSTHPHLPDLVGGLQTTTHDLVLALRDVGADAAILCGLPKGEEKQRPERDEALGYPVFRTADPEQALAKIASSWDATVILVQSGSHLAPLVIRALETGRPVAVYLHNVEMHQVEGTLAPDPSLLYLANSDFTARRWRSLCGIDAAIIPPVIDVDRHVAAQNDAKAGERVLFVNPVQVKGVELMFGLAEASPDLSFLVAESWTIDPRWRAACRRRAQAAGNIAWLAPADDMRPVYAQARALLMPSVWEEAFGRTVIEAQLNGLPVLASRRGALPDTVGAGGLLVDADASVGEWRSALLELLGPAYSSYAQHALGNALRFTAAAPLYVARLLSLLTLHAAR